MGKVIDFPTPKTNECTLDEDLEKAYKEFYSSEFCVVNVNEYKEGVDYVKKKYGKISEL